MSFTLFQSFYLEFRCFLLGLFEMIDVSVEAKSFHFATLISSSSFTIVEAGRRWTVDLKLCEATSWGAELAR